MTVSAERLQALAGQLPGVDDCQIIAAGPGLPVAMQLRVSLPGSVAVLATDRFFQKLGSMRCSHQVHLSGMARQTVVVDLSLKAQVMGNIVPWRHPPLLPGRIPGDRRFAQKAVRFDKVGACGLSGTHEVKPHRKIDAGNLFPIGRRQGVLHGGVARRGDRPGRSVPTLCERTNRRVARCSDRHRTANGYGG